MKKYTFIALGLIFLLSSCSKKRKFEQIKGLDLFDEVNASAGTLGDTDDYFKDAEFKVAAYPVPAANVQVLGFQNTSSHPRTYQMKIVTAYFKHAPDVFPKTQWSQYNGLSGLKINVDNLGGKPDDVHFSSEIRLEPSESTGLAVDISNFKQGFYKVIIDAEGGGRYTRSLWVWRR